MIEPFDVTLPLSIRPCQREDLPQMEWFGMFAHSRLIFAGMFERHEKGEVVMLVAETNDFPVGQIWVDLVKERDQSVGVLYALRVLLPLQNLGIGTRLIAAAETLLQRRGYRTTEIGVEKDNPAAKRLYERLGYRVVDDRPEEWEYATPEGHIVHVRTEQWILRKPLDEAR